MRSTWKDFRRRKVLLVRNYASGEQLADIGLWQKSQGMEGADSIGKQNAKLSQNQRLASACDAAQRCNNPPAVDPGKKQPRRARSCEFLGEAGSSDALQSRGTADTSVDCSSNGQLVQISRAALAAAQLSLEEGKALPADLSAKHCDAAVQEAVVASANTEPAAATVQQSCEFFGEALAFRLSRWIAKTFTLSVAIIWMIIICFIINIKYTICSRRCSTPCCVCAFLILVDPRCHRHCSSPPW